MPQLSLAVMFRTLGDPARDAQLFSVERAEGSAHATALACERAHLPVPVRLVGSDDFTSGGLVFFVRPARPGEDCPGPVPVMGPISAPTVTVIRDLVEQLARHESLEYGVNAKLHDACAPFFSSVAGCDAVLELVPPGYVSYRARCARSLLEAAESGWTAPVASEEPRTPPLSPIVCVPPVPVATADEIRASPARVPPHLSPRVPIATADEIRAALAEYPPDVLDGLHDAAAIRGLSPEMLTPALYVRLLTQEAEWAELFAVHPVTVEFERVLELAHAATLRTVLARISVAPETTPSEPTCTPE